MTKTGADAEQGRLQELEKRLSVVVLGNVDFSTGRRAEYAADASNYRRVPLGVVFPSTTEQLRSVVAICHEFQVPVTMRGGGTSVAGNAIGNGVVVDTSRHLHRVLEIDPKKQTARVQPGVVLDDLQAMAAEHGLRFGPDPSTHSRCTIGGMIGNNSCGARSLAFGRTADNVISLEVSTIDGVALTIERLSPAELETAIAEGGRKGQIYAGLRDLVTNNEQLIREKLGRFDRQISGYSLEHLLPEHGFDLARTLVGTEGTCVVVLEATLRLVPVPTDSCLVVLGFDELTRAAAAVSALLPYRPTAIEGMDHQVVEALRRQRLEAVPDSLLPAGRAWLLVEFAGGAAVPDVEQLLDVCGASGGRVVETPAEQRAIWRIREDGAGLASRTADGSEAWPGWEDAAVPPERLAEYLHELQKLMQRYGRQGAIYGHFGEGCVHTRIDFDFSRTLGVEQFRAFVTDACRLAGEHGGSYSGEHGDGFARSEFLPLMYGRELVSVFEQFKAIWDPLRLLNPEVIVEPARMDEHLRVDPQRQTIPVETTFAYPHDDNDFGKAVRRCVGVGKCRSDSGGVMCPSFRATHDERDSTRGRARVLHEMLQGEVVKDGWRSEEVLDALDLCLSCKGCKSDCPVGVDMATYKAEFLHNHFKGRLRPLAHYSLGWFPLWARLASRAPRLVNALAASPFATFGKKLGGVTTKRPLPRFATQTFREWFSEQQFPSQTQRKDVLLWVDTFTNHLAPEIGRAAVRVMHAAGFNVLIPPADLCCGVTWVSTGQLDQARKVMQQSAAALLPFVSRGIPVVGLEPSCTAVLRTDFEHLQLTPDTPRPEREWEGALTFAEFLDRHAPDWEMPRVDALSLTQVHCHQYAIMGSGADERVMNRLGLENEMLDKGCCGLAGNFGYERDHYDVSVAVAEHGPLPRIRSMMPETLLVSDGFSCRTQIAHLGARVPKHLAQVIADALDA